MKFEISAAVLMSIAVGLLNIGYARVQANSTDLYGWLAVVLGITLIAVTFILVREGYIEYIRKELHR